jgi:uncharacterized protein (DUF433 family)
MNYNQRIVSDYKIMLGKPVIKGTRVTVEVILKKLAEGASVSDVIKMYPNLKKEDVLATLNYASEVISSEEMIAAGK